MSTTQQAYFVIGTDTGVGKTFISAALLRHFVGQGLRAVGMKPVASGCAMQTEHAAHWISDDVLQLASASNVEVPLADRNPYAFEPAIAPHIAAAMAGQSIEIPVILAAYQRLQALADVVIVEGAGGLMVPLNRHSLLLDLVKALGLPVILVVGMRLGCINHALLTAAVLREHQIALHGWVANQIDPNMPAYAANLETLAHWLEAPCLAQVAWQGEARFALTGL